MKGIEDAVLKAIIEAESEEEFKKWKSLSHEEKLRIGITNTFKFIFFMKKEEESSLYEDIAFNRYLSREITAEEVYKIIVEEMQRKIIN